MTREEFVAWAIPAFRRWRQRYPGERATVDRRDPFGHYELANLRVLSYGENSQLQRVRPNLYAPGGMLWCGKCRQHKPVDQFARNRSLWTGYQSRCKACNILDRRRMP